MPILMRPCGAAIHYSVKGSGIPVLLIAPGGMRSCLANWASQPYDPWTALPESHFKLIAMDQRSAQMSGGLSTASFQQGDGWHTFTEDQLALLDHLGVHRCCLLGSCIGPSYQLRLLREAPERFVAAVLMQPIGLTICTTESQRWEGLNTEASSHWFGDWAQEMQQSGKAQAPELASLFEAMFGDGRDFVFSITRTELQAVTCPLLVFMGRDMYHPSEVSREIARIAPRCELIEEWRDAGLGPLQAAAAKIKDFLAEHGDAVPPATL
eukprot:CAMPEP_0171099566 /NCGR_PEP_ID=MMETSP0766_2-20121228/51952_1 /TAXON_ID=439317 /ORGANISM="Gambierdiscus australes, Strain CAWD 149" /LENGTH=266 /DNA_ID=CAMNT_0011559221 /DNA_START=19 /DNA_END=819 /DNA_ORIENTATION=+